ncbi:MAG: 30S ribosome-binding factor RbfA [Oscillospiraceae bacterium]|nr:30S ribosome-binding factor RbfA [Oscillospiraceae bacterium]
MAYKQNRTAEDIKRELSLIISDLKDPRISEGMLTVVRTEVAHDLSFCKVYISSLNGIEAASEACKVLEKTAKGHVRSELGKTLTIRKVPDIKFIPDDTVEKSFDLFKILEEDNKRLQGQ